MWGYRTGETAIVRDGEGEGCDRVYYVLVDVDSEDGGNGRGALFGVEVG